MTEAQAQPYELPSFEQASRKLAVMHAEQRNTISELQSMLRQRDDFLANISHQLRTPLSSIIGYSELLEGGQHNAIAANEEYLHALQDAARTILSILGDMPSLTAATPATWVPQTKAVDLRILVPQLEGFFTYEAKKKDLAFRIHWDEAIPSSLLADAARIRQVLLILTHNAIRFTESGRVSVDFSLQGLHPQRATLRVTVQDTGIGLSETQLHNLFSPSPEGRRFGRAGGNLLLAKQAVEWLGGKLQVESVLGQGSSFSFLLELPVAAQSAPVVEEKPAPPQQNTSTWSKLRVLVADDHAMNRDMLQAMLRKLGVVNTDTVSSGAEAIERCSSGRYDLVLMDCQMPDVDGLSAAKRVKLQPQNRALPIIGITADVLKLDKANCMAAGMEDSFTKPVSLATLGEILTRWGKS